MTQILFVVACGYLGSQLLSSYPDPEPVSYHSGLVKTVPLYVANSRQYYEDKPKNTPVRGVAVGSHPSNPASGQDRVIYNVAGAFVEGTSKMG